MLNTHCLRSVLAKFGIFSVAVLLSASAQAGQGRLSLLWAPTYVMTQTSGISNAPSGALGVAGGGLGLGYMFGSKAGLETHVLYLQRGLTSTTSNNAYSWDVMLRLEPKPWLSFGLGGYYDRYSSGNIVAVSNRRVDDWDYGFIVGGGLRLPVSSHVALLTQAFYKMGLNNQTSVANASFKYSMVQGLVGIEFHGASK